MVYNKTIIKVILLFSKCTLREVFKTLTTEDDFPGFYLTERELVQWEQKLF